jgi:hypothetical protein
LLWLACRMLRQRLLLIEFPLVTEGSKGLKALAVDLVLLMADGILPSSTLVCVLLCVLCLRLH